MLIDASEGSDWIYLSDESKEIGSSPWFCTDGTLIVVRDDQMKVGDLTALKEKYGKSDEGIA